jgi:hypothetical protein
MSVTQLETSIQSLSNREFFALMDWMTERHLQVLSEDGFESAELESELLPSLTGRRFPVDETLLKWVRNGGKV